MAVTTVPPAPGEEDPLLTGVQAARLVRLTYDMWKYWRARGVVPPPDGDALGRRGWRTSTVLGLAPQLMPKPDHAEVMAAFAAPDGPDPSVRAERQRVAEGLSISERTVYRHVLAHRAGTCDCPAGRAVQRSRS